MDKETHDILAQIGTEAALYALAASGDGTAGWTGILFSRIVFEAETNQLRDEAGQTILAAIKEHVVEPLHVDYFDASPLFLPNGIGNLELYLQMTSLCMQAVQEAVARDVVNLEYAPGTLFVRIVCRGETQKAVEARLDAAIAAIRERVINPLDVIRYGDCFPLLAAEAYASKDDGVVRLPEGGLPEGTRVKSIVSVDEEGITVHDESIADLQRELRHLFGDLSA